MSKSLAQKLATFRTVVLDEKPNKPLIQVKIKEGLNWYQENGAAISRLPGKFLPALPTNYMYHRFREPYVGKDVLVCSRMAKEIENAMKFRVSAPVLDSVAKMMDTDQTDLLTAFKFARPPYPLTWIEFPFKEATIGVLIKQGELDEDGNLDSIEVEFLADYDVKNSNSVPSSYNMRRVKIYESGCEEVYTTVSQRFNISTDKRLSFLHRLSERFSSVNRRLTNAYYGADLSQRPEVKIALSTLLLLNSRSQILTTSHPITAKPPEDTSKKKPTLIDINFDIDRILAKAQSNMSEDQARQIQAECLVRGHFKVRKTGVFWWSPYIRNARSENPDLSQHLDRGRRAKVSTDPRPVTLPSAKLG